MTQIERLRARGDTCENNLGTELRGLEDEAVRGVEEIALKVFILGEWEDNQTIKEVSRLEGTLLCRRWVCKLTQPLWRTAWRFLKNLKIALLCMHAC